MGFRQLRKLIPIAAALAASAALLFAVTHANAATKHATFGPNCGSGATAEIVPLVLHDKAGHFIPLAAYPFAAACKKHDACYAEFNFGLGPGPCDTAFVLDMHAVCKARPKPLRNDCYYVAEEYHSQVARKGQSAYQDAQLGTLAKAETGRYPFSSIMTVHGDPNGTQTYPVKGTIVMTAPVPAEATTPGSFGSTLTQPVAEPVVVGDWGNFHQAPPSVSLTAHIGLGGDWSPANCGDDPNLMFDLRWDWGGRSILEPKIVGTVSGSCIGYDNFPDGQFQGTYSGNFIANKASSQSTVPHFDVVLRTTVGDHTTSAAAGVVRDGLPDVGEEIDIGGGTATVDEIRRTADGEPLIIASRTLSETDQLSVRISPDEARRLAERLTGGSEIGTPFGTPLSEPEPTVQIGNA